MNRTKYILLVILLLAVSVDAESWRHWIRHYVFRCACIGNPHVPVGGN